MKNILLVRHVDIIQELNNKNNGNQITFDLVANKAMN